METESLSKVPGHNCSGCTLCCLVVRVDEIFKPEAQWCEHCAIGEGCKIYEARPNECRTWLCGYLKSADVPEVWNPRTSHMVINVCEEDQRAYIQVDPNFPDAWRQEPFYSQLKDEAREAVERRGAVIVRVGRRQVLIFPERELEFAEVGDDEEIIIMFPNAKVGSSSINPMAYKRKKGDPNLGPAHWR